MEETSTTPAADSTVWRKILILGAVALVIILAAVLAYQVWNDRNTDTLFASSGSISEFELQARHGLQVRLLAVTAGGGMIDFRLKLSDPDKARAFLQDPANLPIVLVAEDGTRILAADVMDEDINWEEGGILFMLSSNSGGAIRPGNPVTIEFGDLRLDSIQSQ